MQLAVYGQLDYCEKMRLESTLRQLEVQQVTIPLTKAATVLLPLTEEDIKEVSSLVTKHDNWKALIPPLVVLQDWSDKSRFNSFCQARGLSHLIPQLYNSKDITYPSVFKLTNRCRGRGIHVLTNINDLNTTLQWHVNQPYIIQEYIPGKIDYTTHCVCKQGYLLSQVSYQYIHTEEHVINTSDQTHTCLMYQPSAMQLEILQKFLQAGRFTGPCTIDYRLRANGIPVVLEINPRLGSSLFFKGHRNGLLQQLHAIIQAL